MVLTIFLLRVVTSILTVINFIFGRPGIDKGIKDIKKYIDSDHSKVGPGEDFPSPPKDVTNIGG